MNTATLLVGESGARYRLEPSPAAQGGEARVYRALAEDDGRVVAVKVAQLPMPHGAWLLAQGAWLRRVGSDPQAGPALAPLWDMGRWEDRPFLVFDWYPDLLHAWGPAAPLPARLQALRALIAAVGRLHAVGELHGDLKPANVAVLDEGEAVLLLDPAGEGRPVLTPGFAAPERLRGRPSSPAGDRHALAATAWCLLGEALPSSPPLPAEVRALRRQLGDTPGADALVAVLEAMLQAAPWRRPGLPALVAALDGRSRTRPLRRAPAVLALVALAVSLLAGGRALVSGASPCPAGFAAQGTACAHPDGRRVVLLPAGRYRRGTEGSDAPDAPAHAVTLSRPFWLGEVELTQAQWAAAGGGDPVGTRRQLVGEGPESDCATWLGHDLRGPDLPVVCVSWFDAVGWLNGLSARDGLRPAYTLQVEPGRPPRVLWDRAAEGWRLPTEAEWEWAARGGPSADLGPEPVCARANTRDQGAPEHWGGESPCDDGQPVLGPVRRFAPNGAGLYDMQGNALEWTWDLYGDYPRGPRRDPLGPAIGLLRVIRGGSWNHVSRGPWARYAQRPAEHSHVVGLRLARTAR